MFAPRLRCLLRLGGLAVLVALLGVTSTLGCGSGGGGGSGIGIEVCSGDSSMKALLQVHVGSTGSSSGGSTFDVDLDRGECSKLNFGVGVYDVTAIWSDATLETQIGVVVLTGFTQVTFTR